MRDQEHSTCIIAIGKASVQSALQSLQEGSGHPSNHSLMTARELQSQLQSSQAPHLIHVLPAEIHAACRISGSQNACVYEVAFLDQVRSLVGESSTQIVVYGAGEGSLDAVTAAEKLSA